MPPSGLRPSAPGPRVLSSLLTPAVAVIAAAITLSLWWHERESEQARLHTTFDTNVRQAAIRIEQRVANYEQMLRGLEGLFVAQDAKVDRAAFDHYVETVMEGPDALGMQRLGYNEVVPREALSRHVAGLRSAGSGGYDVFPAGDRPVYAPLVYLSPHTESNVRAEGFDAYTDPDRSQAMMQARDSGNLALTSRVTLRLDAGRSTTAGFVMYLPVYSPGPPPVTTEERRTRLVGWISGGFRVSDMMSSLYGESPAGLEVRLHDGTSTGNASLMYRSLPRGRARSAPESRLALPQFDTQEYIGIAGHTWTMRVRALPEFVERHGRDTSDVILGAGTVLSVLLALLTHQLVTQRHRAHDVAQAMTRELRASEASYRRIVETASEGIWVVDARHRIAFANPQIAQWLDYSDREMTGRPLDDFMDVDEASRCLEAFAQAPGERVATLEVALRRRDRTLLWAALSFRPIVGDDGREAGALCMLTDITDRRAAEEQRLALESQLRESQKMEAIGTLAGGIAHDFNNILAAILGNVAAARHDLAAGAPVDPSLSQIQRAAARARDLVQQILTFSRMQARARDALPVQAVQPLVDEALQLVRATLPEGVRIDLQPLSAPCWVQADPTQLEQVVMNLCTNAWHALPGGHGRIQVGVEAASAEAVARATRTAVPPARPRLDAPASVDEAPGGAWVRLWVADEGVGMDDATQARIFEPFFTTKVVGRGTGLGLAVVHGIVTGHGGRITVRSAPGLGSRFDVWLPAVPMPAPAPAGEAGEGDAATGSSGTAAARSIDGGGARVVCVDDDPAMLLMMQALLERAGYRVTAYDRAAEALAAASDPEADIDLLVTDYTMPGMNGLDLAASIARVAPSLPVVITSGYLPDDLREAARQQGVRAVLQKEYTLERLAGVVHEVLAARAEP